MQEFSWVLGAFVAIFCVVAVTASRGGSYRGTGAILYMKDDDKTVWVAKVIPGSPAEKAGIAGLQLCAVDGTVMAFNDREEFTAWGKAHAETLGTTQCYEFVDNKYPDEGPAVTQVRLKVVRLSTQHSSIYGIQERGKPLRELSTDWGSLPT